MKSAHEQYRDEFQARGMRARDDAAARVFVDGARVEVRISNRAQWNLAAADMLDGATGTIEAIKVGYANDSAVAMLVRFDAPRGPSWSGAMVEHFWFEPRDLAVAS